jgi:hypothetical protein
MKAPHAGLISICSSAVGLFFLRSHENGVKCIGSVRYLKEKENNK